MLTRTGFTDSTNRSFKHFQLTVLFLLFPLFCFAQKHFTLSGYIKDKRSGEVLIGSTVFVKSIKSGTASNTFGFYSLTLDSGTYTFTINSLGYSEQNFSLPLRKNTRLDISLEPQAIETKEVEITGDRPDQNIKSTRVGTIELPMAEIKTLPAFMGEVDILKTIQLLPGVQSAGEGNAGFYVRGGGPDQNLILLEGAQVYNASHMFGFFSIFNSDALRNVTLIKGGMPAEFGGRLASVLDITMKDGNDKKFHGEGGIGFISSRITLEGPIKKEKSSFIFSARRTYIDFLLRPIIDANARIKGSGYYFYDLNAKLNFNLTSKDKLSFSGYYGKDVVSYNNTETKFFVNMPWGNATATARWSHIFNDILFMNTSAVFSDYQFSTDISQRNFTLGLFSGIQDYGLKSDFSYYPTVKHTLKFGYNYTYHVFTPSSVSIKAGNVVLNPKDIKRQYANEYALYLSDEYELSSKFSINGGLRYSAFQDIGPYDRYVKDFQDNITDTIHYKPWQVIKLYQGLEPRITLRYSLDKSSSLKASYTYNQQYMHLVSFTSVTLPTDIWLPSSYRVEPQKGDLYVLGYFRNFKKNLYETSLELYYKEMKNLIEYKDGKTPQDNINDNIENNLTFGSGKSYGAELFIKKTFGKINGWVGYTLSYTNRVFPELNGGQPFFAKYDRRHDLNVVISYELNKKWTCSAVFVFATGNTYTPQVSTFALNSIPYNQPQLNVYTEYADRNSYRMDAYHRMDISFTYIAHKTEKFESSFNFSVYNLYNRANPYFIYVDQTSTPPGNNIKLQVKQVSLFPILPSVSWNFKF